MSPKDWCGGKLVVTVFLKKFLKEVVGKYSDSVLDSYEEQEF